MAYRATLNGEVFFNTNSISQALGLLSASLDLKAGSAGLFSFTVPHVNKYYDHFHLLSDYIDVYRDDEVIFNGRVSSISMNFDLTMNIEAEGLLAVLNDSIFRPTTHEGTLGQLVDKLLQSHNQQVEGSKLVYVGTIANPTRNAYRQYENYESTFSRISDLVDSFGGYPTIRKTNGVLYLDWPSSITTVGAQSVDFGENEISINEDANTDDYITVLIPLGAQIEDEDTGERARLTIESVNSGKDYIELAEATNKVVGVYTWDDITVASNLLTAGQAYLNAQSVLKTTIEVTAVDLADTGLNIDNFKIGTLIRVTSKPHGLDNQSFECIEQKLNLLDPADNNLTLGGTLEGFTIKAQKEALLNTKVIERVEANYVTNQRVNDIKTDLEQDIQTNSTLIEQNAQQITLLATQTNSLDSRMSAAELKIEPNAITTTVMQNVNYTQSQNNINLLPSVYSRENVSGEVYNNSGITWTLNKDGSLTATGTATANASYYFTGTDLTASVPVITLDPNKRYCLHGCPAGGSSSTYMLRARFTEPGTVPSGSSGELHDDYGDGYVTTDARKFCLVYVKICSGYSCPSGGLTFYPMLEAGTIKHAYSSSHNGTGALTSRMKSAESSITQNANNIALKVSQTDYTGATIASLINQSASTVTISAAHINLTGANIVDRINNSSVTIDAARINLNGAVTANSYFKINTDGSMEAASGTIAGWNITNDAISKTVSDYTTYLYAPSNLTTTTRAIGVEHRDSTGTVDERPFFLRYDGYLAARKAVITGTITNIGDTSTATLADGVLKVDRDAALNSDAWNGIWLRYVQNGNTLRQSALRPQSIDIVNYDQSNYEFYGSPTGVGIRNLSTNVWKAGFNVNSRSDGESLLYSAYIEYTYSCSQASDMRLKENITPIDAQDAEQRVMSWKPVRYKYLNNNGYHHGFLAQNIEETRNDDKWEIVTDNEMTGYKSLAYTELFADLVATVQKMHDEIQALKEE